MSLDNIVDVQISAETATPTREGFGTPLILTYKEDNITASNRVRTYSTAAEMLDDGFTTDDPGYKMATALKSQDPSPSTFKVGMRQAPTKTFEVTPTSTTEGTVHSIDFDGNTASYTVQAGDTTADIVTGLTSAISTAAPTATVTDELTHVGVAYPAGELPEIDNISVELEIEDTTTDPGVASDLNAAIVADNDWYCLLLDSHSVAETKAAAAWVESNDKIFIVQQMDNLRSDDSMSELQTAAYERTATYYLPRSSEWIAAAVAGKVLPEDPGSLTWEFKTLAGISTYFIYTNLRTAIEARNGNYYERIAGNNVTRGGGVSAAGEYMDVRRGIDWLTARIKENVFTVLLNQKKLPYTNRGLSVLKGVILQQLGRAVDRDFLSEEPAPSVTVPDVDSIPTADKSNRHVPDVTFEGTLAGAVHSTKIKGTLTL